MNVVEKNVARAALIIVVLMLLFPPWFVRAANGLRTNLGYDLVMSAPSARAEIDLTRLLIQLTLVGTATLGFIKLRGAN